MGAGVSVPPDTSPAPPPCLQWGFMTLAVRDGTDKWLGKEASMDSGQPRSSLIKLSELDVPLEESWQDIRDLDVYDVADQQIGSVADLYVDREARQPSYL